MDQKLFLQVKYWVCKSKLFSFFGLKTLVSCFFRDSQSFKFSCLMADFFFAFTINKLQQCFCPMYFLITVRKDSVSAHVVCKIKTQSKFILTWACCVEVRCGVVSSGVMMMMMMMKLHQSRSSCCPLTGLVPAACGGRGRSCGALGGGACCHQHLVTPVITPRYSRYFSLLLLLLYWM